MSNVLLALVGGAFFFLGGNALAQEDPAHEQMRSKQIQVAALSHVAESAIARSERRAILVARNMNGQLVQYAVLRSDMAQRMRHLWIGRKEQLIAVYWQGSNAYLSALPPPTDPASAEIGPLQPEGVRKASLD